MLLRWTPAGIKRLDEDCDRLRAWIAENTPATVGNSRCERQVKEVASLLQEIEQRERRLIDKQSLLQIVVPMKRPDSCDRVQPGHEIQISYCEPRGRKKRGDTETFVLGGWRETDTDSILRTYGLNSPLGKAVLNKCVGDIVEVEVADGTYAVKIESIAVAGRAFVINANSVAA